MQEQGDGVSKVVTKKLSPSADTASIVLPTDHLPHWRRGRLIKPAPGSKKSDENSTPA